MKTIKFLLAIFASLVVAACGGGGSSTPASNTISGFAAKGPIGTAEVLVFKAGDYSGAASGVAASGNYPDDSKALNYSSPAQTDPNTGHYSVNIGSNSGPVIIVVRPKSAGSTMCNELTGNCTLAFNFRMRAALASVAANTTAHITPFTEMAAKAVGTSTDPAVINTANALVRTKVLPGLDPLTTSPVVDSRVPTTEQSAQKEMVVALAAVAQAGNSTITNTAGTACNSLAVSGASGVNAAQIECAVDALSNTMGSATATGATIDGSKVAAFNTAMGSLTTINVPTLNSSGTLTTTTTLDTTTDTDASMVQTGVATNSAALGTSTTPVAVTPPTTTVLSGVDKAKAFFSDLRTTLHLFSNGTKTGLLDAQGTRIQTDMAGNIAPRVEHDIKRFGTMMDGTKLFSTPSSFIPECVLSGSTVTCQINDNNYYYSYPGMTSNYVEVAMTSPSPNSFSYTATAKQCTYNASNVCGSPVTDTTKATGSGTMSQTVDTLGNLTGATVHGTFPGSQVGTVQDSVALTGNVTGPATGSQRIDFSGSVSSYGGSSSAPGGTGITVDTTPMVTLTIGSGSYATDQQVTHAMTQSCGMSGCSYVTCITNCTWPEPSALNVILVANTPNTKFTGTLTMGSGMLDASHSQWIPTTAVFIGTIADTSASGAGTFMTGKLELATSNYASVDATVAGSGNSLLATAKFTGTLAFPGAQPMGLVLAGSKTGLNTGTTSVNFSYGNGKTISVTSAPIDGTSTSNTVTLTNQDGLKLTLVEGVPSVNVTVGSDTTPVATVSGNMINYADGYVESIN